MRRLAVSSPWAVLGAILGALLILPPVVYAIDREAFIFLAAAGILGLPILDAAAAGLYSVLWYRAKPRPVTLGLSALFAWLTAFGLGLAVEAAYRRLLGLPPVDRTTLLIGWGYIILGSAPFTSALVLLLERRRRTQQHDAEE